MEKPSSYCEYVKRLPGNDLNKIYHDTQYGFPIQSDNELFGRLILEINQAGLSWTTILKKQEAFRSAFSNYDIAEIAAYDQTDKERLLSNVGIIRNRRKIDAVIHNAKVIIRLQSEYGSFKAWLDHHHPLELEQWIKLFKQTFKFTGKEITNEFLMSTGYLKGAHIDECPIYKTILTFEPKWIIANEKTNE